MHPWYCKVKVKCLKQTDTVPSDGEFPLAIALNTHAKRGVASSVAHL